MIRIKVCCIRSVNEARRAVRAGAHAVGLVSAMPSGPGVIDDAQIATIAAHVPPPVASFLLTSRQDPDAIVRQQRQCRATALQLVDAIDPSHYPVLREQLPGTKLVQVIHVTGPDSVDEAVAVAPHVDAILLDSGSPTAEVKTLGGTGRTHDWTLSRRIVEAVDTPVFLAGGLNADNVADAIRAVRPFGVDLCSGLRTDGALDDAKLHRFVDAVRAG